MLNGNTKKIKRKFGLIRKLNLRSDDTSELSPPCREAGPTGFSFFELMVTVAILSFGIVMVFQAFIVSLNTFSYYLTHLQVQNWADEKIWEISDKLMQKDSLDSSETNGNCIIGSKKIAWNIYIVPIDEKNEFFNLSLILSWQEGSRRIEVQRATYAGI